jgi:hypothetical protein
MYTLIQLLHEDASLLPISAKLISQGKMDREVTKASSTKGRKLQRLWDDYDAGNISTTQYLRSCAQLHK